VFSLGLFGWSLFSFTERNSQSVHFYLQPCSIKMFELFSGASKVELMTLAGSLCPCKPPRLTGFGTMNTPFHKGNGNLYIE
jgi:hypothetical protein